MDAGFFEQNPELLIESWGIRDGLPVDAAVQVTQCERGFIWFTTYEGIVRFDGLEFRVYDTITNPELTTNRFTWIHRDEVDPSIIWFVPEYGGMVRMQDGEFTYIGESSGFTDLISFEPLNWNGYTVFATHDGLFFYDHTRGEIREFIVDAKHNVSSHLIHALASNSGNLYVATLNEIYLLDQEFGVQVLNFENYDAGRIEMYAVDDGVLIYVSRYLYYYYEGGGLTRIDLDTRHDGLNGYGISVDGNRVYVNSQTGLSVLSAKDDFSESFTEKYDPNFGRLTSVVLKFGQFTYLLTDKGNYIILQNDELLRFSDKPRKAFIGVYRMLKDQDGNVWLTTFFNGLLRVSKPLATSIRTDANVPDDRVIGIYEDHRGHIWVSTRRGEFYRIREDGVPHRQELRFGTNRTFEIYAFTSSTNGTLYAGINRWGIARQKTDNSFEILNLDLPANVSEIRALAVPDDETIWIGMTTGLFQFKNDVLQPYPCYDLLSTTFINQIKELPNDDGLWVATLRKGAFYINSKTGECRNYNVSDGLGHNSVRGIYPDRYETGTVWFATEGGGLSRYRSGKLHTLNSAKGLFRDLLHNVIEDYEGRLWMSTNQGIFFVNKAKVNRFLDGEAISIVPVVFTEREGLANAEGNGGFQNSYILRENGDLLFSTQTGMAYFQTSGIRDFTRQTVPVIDKISTPNRSWNFPQSVVLSPDERDFSIYYTANNFNAPLRTQFWYKLEGYDDKWNTAGGRRIVSYTNLPPRTYTFRLTTINPFDPAANAETLSFTELLIIKQPRFFETWWFRLLSLLLFLFLAYTAFQYKIQSYTRQELVLKNKVEERTKELRAEKEAAQHQRLLIEKQADDLQKMNKEKDRFFSIIAHDLRGPFMGIRGLIDILREDYGEMNDEQVREILILLSKSAQNHSKLLENLLNWARIQLNQIHLEFRPADATNILEQAAGAWELPAKNKNISFNLELSPFTLVTDKNMLNTVLRNLISNAVKFSWPDSVISLRCYSTGNEGVFEVEDKGTGMSEEQLNNLSSLEKLVSQKGTSDESGTGLGLILVCELVKLMKGTLEVESEKEKGTRFIVRLPLEQDKE
ncbi:MAG: hypothetical protein LAT67_11490 [Balneolales bacterium]|nr:hypothetical protein [Balneolales bacterium]